MLQPVRDTQRGGGKAAPEDFKDSLTVGSHFLDVQPGVPMDGGCIPLDAEVASQLDVESYLH